jgi:hypothetical protein
MGQLDAQHGAGPQQPSVDESGTVIDIYRLRDAPAGQGGTQRGGQPHGVLGVSEPVPHHRPAVIINEGEQVGFPARHHRPVQSVAGPAFVGAGRFEPAEHRGRRRRWAGKFQPGEQAQRRGLRWRPAQMGPQDPHHLRRGALRVLPLERRGHVQNLDRGTCGDLPGRGQQRVEPATAPRGDPPVQALARHPHRCPERAGMLPVGQRANQPATLACRQPKIGGLPHQLVAEQRHRPGALGAHP